jgi:hypothetical protein
MFRSAARVETAFLFHHISSEWGVLKILLENLSALRILFPFTRLNW